MILPEDLKNFNKEPLTVALKELEANDKSIRKSDFKNKSSLIQALIVRGFDIYQLPTKSSLKEVNKMAKAAAKNALKARNEANKALGIPLEKPVRVIRQVKPKKDLTERQMAIAEFRRSLPEPLAVGPRFKGPLMPNQIRLKGKVDLEKKAAKKAITEANKVAKKAAKEAEKAIKKAAKAQQKEKKLIDREAFKRTLPEPLAVGPNFRGPLMPNQIRRKRSPGSAKLNNLFI